jgi:hypothetical protein
VELSWLMKLRIAASMAAGVVLIGVLAWPLAKPPEPFGTVSVTAGTVSFSGAIVLSALALLAGFIAYFVSYPYGREIGILAAPAGLTIWALRTGNMVSLIRRTAPDKQAELFAALRWEPLLWLAIVAAGFAGVLLAKKINRRIWADKKRQQSETESNIKINIIIALLASVLLGQLCISIFAQNIKILDEKLGLLVAQPSTGQIVFAVFISFGIAAFVVKKFLNVSYIWPTIATAFVTSLSVISYGRQDVLQYLNSNWPTNFFSHAVLSILPLQIVAVGTLGSIAGYWMAVRYQYWRKHA